MQLSVRWKKESRYLLAGLACLTAVVLALVFLSGGKRGGPRLVAAGGETVLFSSDGGKTWKARPSAWKDYGDENEIVQPVPSDCAFSDSSHLWVATWKNLLYTSDGGSTWKTVGRFDGSVINISFPDSLHGWVSGYAVRATSDGGRSWTEQNTPDTGLTSVSFIDDKYGWAGGIWKLAATSDGGRSWTMLAANAHWDAEKIVFVDRLHGWLAGHKGLFATSDGGKTWKRTGPSDYYVTNLVFTDRLHGWTVGMNGSYSLIDRTVDGGKHWIPQWWKDAYPSDIAFADHLHGWIAGMGGLILSTADGGKTWKRQSSGTNENLTCIAVSPS